MSFSNGLGEMGLGELGLGEWGLGEMGLGEMGGHRSSALGVAAVDKAKHRGPRA